MTDATFVVTLVALCPVLVALIYFELKLLKAIFGR